MHFIPAGRCFALAGSNPLVGANKTPWRASNEGTEFALWLKSQENPPGWQSVKVGGWMRPCNLHDIIELLPPSQHLS